MNTTKFKQKVFANYIKFMSSVGKLCSSSELLLFKYRYKKSFIGISVRLIWSFLRKIFTFSVIVQLLNIKTILLANLVRIIKWQNFPNYVLKYVIFHIQAIFISSVDVITFAIARTDYIKRGCYGKKCTYKFQTCPSFIWRIFFAYYSLSDIMR